MKKLTLSVLLAVAGIFAGAVHADSQPADCSLKFNVHIDSLLIFSKGEGHGVVTCWGADKKVAATSKVHIDIEGIGLGIGTFDLAGVAGSVGVTDPRELAGQYAVAEANIAIGGAIGASLGFEGQQNGLQFTGNVNAGQGVGVFLNGTRWTITLVK